VLPGFVKGLIKVYVIIKPERAAIISVAWIRERANKNEFQLTGHAHKERQEEVIKTKDVA
jgi:hypothetical protein